MCGTEVTCWRSTPPAPTTYWVGVWGRGEEEEREAEIAGKCLRERESTHHIITIIATEKYLKTQID